METRSFSLKFTVLSTVSCISSLEVLSTVLPLVRIRRRKEGSGYLGCPQMCNLHVCLI